MRNWEEPARKKEGWRKVIGEAMAQKSAEASWEKKKNKNLKLCSLGNVSSSSKKKEKKNTNSSMAKISILETNERLLCLANGFLVKYHQSNG